MALWVCGGKAGCGTKYAVGLFRCPRCHNTEFFEDGDPMAKISRHGGASDKTLPTDAAAEPASTPTAEADHTEPEPLDVTEHVRGEPGPELVDMPDGGAMAPPAAEEGGEEPSPGSSSSASTEPQPTNSEPNVKPRRKPARKTASPSGRDRTESSSAPSTAGEKTDASSATDSGE